MSFFGIPIHSTIPQQNKGDVEYFQGEPRLIPHGVHTPGLGLACNSLYFTMDYVSRLILADTP